MRRRVWTARRRGEEALRPRDRFAALKARQPFLNPILAYFLGSPGFGTRVPSKEPLLSDAQSSGAVLTIPVRAVADRVGVVDVALAAITLQEVGGLAHVIHTAQLQLSLPTAGQSISREAITDFRSITIRQQRRHHIPRSSKNRAGREPSRVCVCWHTGQPLIPGRCQYRQPTRTFHEGSNRNCDIPFPNRHRCNLFHPCTPYRAYRIYYS